MVHRIRTLLLFTIALIAIAHVLQALPTISGTYYYYDSTSLSNQVGERHIDCQVGNDYHWGSSTSYSEWLFDQYCSQQQGTTCGSGTSYVNEVYVTGVGVVRTNTCVSDLTCSASGVTCS